MILISNHGQGSFPTFVQTFLPILIFESAFGMPIDMFVRSVWSILLVAMPGMVLATLLTATLVWQIPWSVKGEGVER